MSIISIAQRFFFLITPTLLGIFSNTNQISIFSIIVIVEGYVWTFSHALNGVFIAPISRIAYQDNGKQLINDLFIKVGRIQMLTSGFIVLLILTFGKEFIMLWLGETFADAYFGLCFIIGVSFFTLTQDVAQTYLFVENKIKFRAYSLLIGALLSLVFSIFLIPQNGAIGAAIAIFIGVFVSQVVLMNIVYKKQLSLDITNFFKSVHFKFIVPFITLFSIGWITKNLLPIHSFYQLFFHGLFFVLLYIVFSWFLILNKYEKQYLLNTIFYNSRIISKND
jgi:O-antigen/teichoic acid export membrane protein